MARRRSNQTPAPAQPGSQACALCGEVVPVGEDGRCELGHRVFTPRAASEMTQPLSHVEAVPPDARSDEPPAAGGVEAQNALDDEEGKDTDGDDDEPLDFSSELDW